MFDIFTSHHIVNCCCLCRISFWNTCGTYSVLIKCATRVLNISLRTLCSWLAVEPSWQPPDLPVWPLYSSTGSSVELSHSWYCWQNICCFRDLCSEIRQEITPAVSWWSFRQIWDNWSLMMIDLVTFLGDLVSSLCIFTGWLTPLAKVFAVNISPNLSTALSTKWINLFKMNWFE